MAIESWRIKKFENYKREFLRTKSYNPRPPKGSWQPTLPSWEEFFCSVMGGVPWKKILDNKKYMSIYDQVVQWNDSAGEEAFTIGKAQFWAELNNLPCHISLLSPDLYIDEIDWDSKVDPELILEMERGRIASDLKIQKDEEAAILDNLILQNKPIVPTGWVDDYDEDDKIPKFIDCDKNWDVNENSWGRSCCAQGNGNVNDDGRGNRSNKWVNNVYDSENLDNRKTDGGWGNCSNKWVNNNVYDSENLDNRKTDGGWGNCSNKWVNNNVYDSENLDNRKTDGGWGKGNQGRNTRNGGGGGGNNSRYKTVGFYGDNNYQRDHGLRDRKGRKTVDNNVYNGRQTVSRQWKMVNSPQPWNHKPIKAEADS